MSLKNQLAQRLAQLTAEERIALANRLDALDPAPVKTAPDNNKRQETRLVAYVVPNLGAKLDPTEIRKALADRLPDYLVPSAVVALDALPRTPNGKIDRLSLPTAAPAPVVASSVTPSSNVEKELITLWCDVLARESVGMEDNFFDLGGHSLTATVLVSKIRKSFGIDLALRALFDLPTIVQLAPAVEKALAEGKKTSEPALKPVPRDQHRAKPETTMGRG